MPRPVSQRVQISQSEIIPLKNTSNPCYHVAGIGSGWMVVKRVQNQVGWQAAWPQWGRQLASREATRLGRASGRLPPAGRSLALSQPITFAINTLNKYFLAAVEDSCHAKTTSGSHLLWEQLPHCCRPRELCSRICLLSCSTGQVWFRHLDVWVRSNMWEFIQDRPSMIGTITSFCVGTLWRVKIVALHCCVFLLLEQSYTIKGQCANKHV